MSLLHTLLDEGIGFDPHYLPSMNSDHLPMTLCAIRGLGGDDAALLAFRAAYRTRLREVAPGPMIETIEEGRGRPECYAGLLAILRDDVNRRGRTAVLQSWLPSLVPSLACEAFHALIRLGYAIAFESDAEVAAALAYWLSADFPVPVSVEPTDLSKRLREQARAPVSMQAGRFDAGLRELVASDRYPVGAADSLETCAHAALDVYRATRNFFALHLVTATQAARACVPYVDENVLVAALSGGILAGHRIVGSPHFEPDRPLPVPERLDREHALKYVYACHSEQEIYHDPRYAEEIAGCRAAGLVPAWAAVSRTRL